MSRRLLAFAAVATVVSLPACNPGGASLGPDAGTGTAPPPPLVGMSVTHVALPESVTIATPDGGTRAAASQEHGAGRFYVVSTDVRYARCEDAPPPDAGTAKVAVVAAAQAMLIFADQAKEIADGWADDPNGCVDCAGREALACSGGGPPAPKTLYFFFDVERTSEDVKAATFEYRDVRTPLAGVAMDAPPPSRDR